MATIAIRKTMYAYYPVLKLYCNFIGVNCFVPDPKFAIINSDARSLQSAMAMVRKYGLEERMVRGAHVTGHTLRGVVLPHREEMDPAVATRRAPLLLGELDRRRLAAEEGLPHVLEGERHPQQDRADPGACVAVDGEDANGHG